MITSVKTKVPLMRKIVGLCTKWALLSANFKMTFIRAHYMYIAAVAIMLRTKIQSALCNGTPGLLPITIWKFFNNHISGMLLHIYCQLLRGIFCCCTCRISLLFTKIYFTYCASYFGPYFKAYFFSKKYW